MSRTIRPEVSSASGLSASTDLVHFVTSCTGELPVEIIRLKAKGVIPHDDAYGVGCGLGGNKGFTLPSNIGELGDDITELNLRNCSLTGSLSTRTERLRSLLTFKMCRGSRPRPEKARELDQSYETFPSREQRAASPGRRANQ